MVSKPVGYGTIFVILILGGLGLPVPEDIVIITGGVLVKHGITNLFPTMLVALTGAIIGDIIIYIVGNKLGGSFLESKYSKFFIRKKTIELFKERAQKGDIGLIIIGRFTPGLRAPIYFSVGMVGMNLKKFLIIDIIAGLISIPVGTAIGVLLGHHIQIISKGVEKFTEIAIFTVILMLIIFLGYEQYHLIKKRLTK